MTAPAPAPAGRRFRLPGPTWAWIVGGAATVGVIYVLYRRYRAAQTAAAANTAAAGAAAANPVGATDQYSTPVTILPMFQGGPSYPAPTTTASQLPPTTGYTVTGATTPSDQWPAGVAIAAYKLTKGDAIDASYYAVLITLANPGQQPPYPVGTTLQIPINPNTTTNTSPYPATRPTASYPPYPIYGPGGYMLPSQN
jgi:hypothetical protein